MEALERLQALKAVVRELEASELAILLTGRAQDPDAYDAAQGDILRLHGDLDGLLDAPPQRERLQQLAFLRATSRLPSAMRLRRGPPGDGPTRGGVARRTGE